MTTTVNIEEAIRDAVLQSQTIRNTIFYVVKFNGDGGAQYFVQTHEPWHRNDTLICKYCNGENL